MYNLRDFILIFKKKKKKKRVPHAELIQISGGALVRRQHTALFSTYVYFLQRDGIETDMDK